MENLTLSPETKKVITDYIREWHLAKHEMAILNEIMNAVGAADQNKLDWFTGFGTSLRHIHVNVHAYRKGLKFGFTDISFDEHGWLLKPAFQDREDLRFGNADRYSEHSTIHLAKGMNHIWIYTLNYSYDMAGGGSFPSVYDKQFNSRKDALQAGLNQLKDLMIAKIGNTDTSNYNQGIISATPKDIAKYQVNMVQLTLFLYHYIIPA